MYTFFNKRPLGTDYMNVFLLELNFRAVHMIRAVARTLIGGEGCIFIYSRSSQLVSFEIKLISKEVSRA